MSARQVLEAIEAAAALSLVAFLSITTVLFSYMAIANHPWIYAGQGTTATSVFGAIATWLGLGAASPESPGAASRP